MSSQGPPGQQDHRWVRQWRDLDRWVKVAAIAGGIAAAVTTVATVAGWIDDREDLPGPPVTAAFPTPSSTTQPPDGPAWELLRTGTYLHSSGHHANFDVARGELPEAGQNFGPENDLYLTSGDDEPLAFQGGYDNGKVLTSVVAARGPPGKVETCTSGGSSGKVHLDTLMEGSKLCVVSTTGRRRVLLEVRDVRRSPSRPLATVTFTYWIWGQR